MFSDPVNLIDPNGLSWFKPDNHNHTVGREGVIGFEPGKGITGFIENNIPAGHTFGYIHDGWVDSMQQTTWLPESFVNYVLNPLSMSPAFSLAILTEILYTFGWLLEGADLTHTDQHSKCPKGT